MRSPPLRPRHRRLQGAPRGGQRPPTPERAPRSRNACRHRVGPPSASAPLPASGGPYVPHRARRARPCAGRGRADTAAGPWPCWRRGVARAPSSGRDHRQSSPAGAWRQTSPREPPPGPCAPVPQWLPPGRCPPTAGVPRGGQRLGAQALTPVGFPPGVPRGPTPTVRPGRCSPGAGPLPSCRPRRATAPQAAIGSAGGRARGARRPARERGTGRGRAAVSRAWCEGTTQWPSRATRDGPTPGPSVGLLTRA